MTGKIALKIETLGVDELTEYDGNARQHGREDVEAIEKSISLFGFNDPIGIWSEQNVIVEGHGRLKAARNLGMTEVPCIRLDHLTDEERRAYALAHNKTAELSKWDFEKLNFELLGIKEIDMQALGFDEEEPISVDDVVEVDIPESAPAIAERGAVFVLGNHRLMCGDSTSKEDMDALMGG